MKATKKKAVESAGYKIQENHFVRGYNCKIGKSVKVSDSFTVQTEYHE